MSTLDDLQRRTARWASVMAAGIERRPWLALGVCSFLYFIGFGGAAYSKALSSDELFSLYISRLSNASEIWKALSQGADSNPPVHYVLLHAAHKLFGDSALAGRLPFLLAVWGMALFLYSFVKKRYPPIYGLIAF